MDVDDEDFFAPPPGLSEGGGEDFLAPPPIPVVLGPRGSGRCGRVRAFPRSGEIGVWLVSHLAGEAPSGSRGPRILQADAVEPKCLDGLAVVSWEFSPSTHDEASSLAGQPVADSSGRGVSGATSTT
jgi:hypothetical protein